jgi:HAD superfamily hydrolase (TIGR01509 family)
MSFQAIIWDCDGVLLDSEVLACGVSAAFYTAAGFPLTASDYIRRFAGQSRAQIAAAIMEETGKDLASAIDWTRKEADREALFESELRAVTGIEEVLKEASAWRLPAAVASGSSLRRLKHSLTLTGLWDYFAPHIYSSEQVVRGKPAPDIYLLAAARLGVCAERCLVVEDAEHGTRAGKAAGMTVYGFTGASHCTYETADSLRAAGADAVFSDSAALRAALGTIPWSESTREFGRDR